MLTLFQPEFKAQNGLECGKKIKPFKLILLNKIVRNAMQKSVKKANLHELLRNYVIRDP